MSKVQLKIAPTLAGILNLATSDWVTFDKEVGEETTISDLLASLASDYSGFRKVVFDPDTGKVTDQVSIVLNDKLLQFPRMKTAKLNDGDNIILMPMYAGG